MRHQILNIIMHQLGLTGHPSTTLTLLELGADSLDVLQIVLTFEQRWQIRMPENFYVHAKHMDLEELIARTSHVMTHYLIYLQDEP